MLTLQGKKGETEEAAGHWQMWRVVRAQRHRSRLQSEAGSCPFPPMRCTLEGPAVLPETGRGVPERKAVTDLGVICLASEFCQCPVSESA